MKLRIQILIVFILIGFATSSCDTSVVFEKNEELPEMVWKTQDVKSYEVDIQDTMKLYDLYFNLRNSKSYRYANLYVFVKTTYPSGKLTNDTLQFFLANPEGRWLGKSAGDLITHQIMFSHNMSFPEAGTYKIEFEQGMRDADLEYISDVGLRVAHSQ